MIRRRPRFTRRYTPFPYPTLCRSAGRGRAGGDPGQPGRHRGLPRQAGDERMTQTDTAATAVVFLVRTNAKVAYYFDYRKLRLPLVGPILQQIGRAHV